VLSVVGRSDEALKNDDGQGEMVVRQRHAEASHSLETQDITTTQHCGNGEEMSTKPQSQHGGRKPRPVQRHSSKSLPMPKVKRKIGRSNTKVLADRAFA
jgi:hypothetical protein